MTITEDATLPFKAGIDITDASSDAYSTLRSALDVVRGQPGYEELWIGATEEASDQVHLYINWDRIESHQAFINNESDYSLLVKHLGTLLAGPVAFIHIPYQPAKDLRSAFSGPVTEHARLYFPLGTDKDQMIKNFKAFSDASVKAADGWGSSTAGWAVEQVENAQVGGKTQVFCLAISWPSVEKHMEYRASEPFKTIAPTLTEGVYLKHIDMIHVKMVQEP